MYITFYTNSTNESDELSSPEFRPGWDSNSPLTPKQIHCTLVQLGGQEIRYRLEYWIWGDDCTGPQLHIPNSALFNPLKLMSTQSFAYHSQPMMLTVNRLWSDEIL